MRRPSRSGIFTAEHAEIAERKAEKERKTRIATNSN